MDHARLTMLLTGHALADDVPLAPVLEKLNRPSARRAARAAQAGQLQRSLELVGIPADLVDLTLRWPAALRPSLKRLEVLPPAPVYQGPLLQVLGVMMVLATLQLLIGALLHTKVMPSLVLMGVEMGSQQLSGLGPIFLGDVVVLGVAVLLTLWAMNDRWAVRERRSWRAHLLRARQACLLAAMHDAAAPVDVRNAVAQSLARLDGRGADTVELELVIQQALATAEAAHRRLIITLRVVGYGLLTALALLMLVQVYHRVALFGVSL